MKRRLVWLPALFVASISAAGCSTSPTPEVFEVSPFARADPVECRVVEAAIDFELRNRKSSILISDWRLDTSRYAVPPDVLLKAGDGEFDISPFQIVRGKRPIDISECGQPAQQINEHMVRPAYTRPSEWPADDRHNAWVSRPAISVDGKSAWVVIDEGFCGSILTLMLSKAEALDWRVDRHKVVLERVCIT